jgi:glycine cleavage system protein P-like pyridoxal-binding family
MVDPLMGAPAVGGRSVHTLPLHLHVVFTAPVDGGGPTQQPTAMSERVTGSYPIGL